MPIAISDTSTLHKIIDLQTCIIEGKSIKAILRKNIDYFLKLSGADIITVYMHEHDMVNPEYILEKEMLFSHLLKKYLFNQKNFRWEKFVDNCDKHFELGLKHDMITELYQLFRGFLNKREATYFTKELQMTHAIMMPVLAFNEKEIIGYVCFISQSECEMEMKKLEMTKCIFQSLLRPLYDREINTLYSRCIRIDEDMNFLTHQEKKIVKLVLAGDSYANIAKSLNISINTLKTHMKNIFNKSNVNSKIELFNKYYISL